MPVMLALALQLSPALSDDFQARVSQAKLAESAATGPGYQKALWDRIGNPTTDAYKSCLASNTPADPSPFTMVANVTADGRLEHIDVQPQTAVAKCMAGQFSSWTLPPPPAAPRPYPIEIDFSIKK
ncbi:peptidase C13 [Dyella solisilvae]|uniref:Peptidase C13 n=1 Tax=Dyella solisilvae TaxID=1920168 RepID=A0A370K7U9_9GAMM|nr:peptidase C13 [Dyella solisilvae]RDI98722.1 peptidase C13 [Dyella solisilvae]